MDQERHLAVNRRHGLDDLGVAPPFDGATVRRLSAANRDEDAPFWNILISFVANSDPEVGWSQLVRAIEATADDDLLCYLGVTALEGFIEDHPRFVLARRR
jgi:hypothetical protein